MTEKIGFIHVSPVDASAVVPPEGHILYAEDTDKLYKSDGTTKTELSSGGGSYSDEQAQDAVGSMVDSTLVYTDATPLLSRAALTGDVTASAGSNATTIANDSVTDAKLRNSAALSVIGRSANSSGDPADIAGATVGHVLQVLSGPTIGFGVHRLPCWNNPPASPHSYDDEFDSGALDAKWTRSSSGTTNPVTTGTIDYTASLTTPITDATSVPSILMFQSDNSVNGFVKITQTYSPATNETHFFKILSNAQNISTNGEASLFFTLINSTDSNEVIGFGSANSGTVHNNYCYVNNNGTLSGTSSASYTEMTRVPASYLVVWKKGNDYYFGMAGEDKKLFTTLPMKTKTGVTTFDRIEFYFQTANETPSIVEGLDFYRYKASLDYSLVNP